MKVTYITEPLTYGGIHKYTQALIQAIGNRMEILSVPFNAEIPRPWDQEIIHIQHAYGYIPAWRHMDRYLRKWAKAKIITLHEVPIYPREVWETLMPPEVNFVVGNEMMAKKLLKLGVRQNNLTVIPHGATIWSPMDKTSARIKLNLNIPYKYIIVQPGFISWGKGIHEVIQAISQILDVYIVFAGSIHPKATPRDRQYITQCMKEAKRLGVENRVHFTGNYLSEDEMNLWLSAADILILNHQLVYGVLSASAMAKRILCAGRPIIMSHDVRLSEYIKGVHCLKIVPEDVVEIESAIRTLINDEELGRKLAENARSYAEQTSWAKSADKHLELYEKCISAK